MRFLQKHTTICLILATASSIGECLVITRSHLGTWRKKRYLSSMKMYLDGIDPSLSPVDITSLLSPSTSRMSKHIVTDPHLEAELLNDASHLALDFTTFINGSNTAWVRLCNLLGRIMVITSDYIQVRWASLHYSTKLFLLPMPSNG